MAEDNQAALPGTDAPAQTRPTPQANAGSGQFAVYDHDLGQYVSGVSDKDTASKAAKDMGKASDGAITDGHKLEVIEV